MGLGDFVKNAVKKANMAGVVSGSAFPLGTYINFADDGSEKCMIFTYPDKSEEKITHDMIKCATVLAMGVMDFNDKGQEIHGTKYLCVLKDGRQAVLTTRIGATLYMVERILF